MGWARVSVSGNSTLQLGQVIVISCNMTASFGFGWGCLLHRNRRLADNKLELYSGLLSSLVYGLPPRVNAGALTFRAYVKLTSTTAFAVATPKFLSICRSTRAVRFGSTEVRLICSFAICF